MKENVITLIKKYKNELRLIAFLLLIPYYEFVFRAYTDRNFSLSALALCSMLSVSYGALFLLLRRLLKWEKFNRGLTILSLVLLPILYMAHFLIYRSFKVFYDVKTCINGAGGALTGFYKDILRLIFCFDGLSALFFFAVPLILYLVFGKKFEHLGRRSNWGLVHLAIICVIIGKIASILIARDEILVLLCTKEYSYQTAVEDFGLLTGLGMDIVRLGQEDELRFETETISPNVPLQEPVETTPAVSADTTDPNAQVPEEIVSPSDGQPEAEEAEEKEIEYGYNAYDLDYEALAETVTGVNRDLDLYVASLTPSKQNAYTGLFKGKNLILISAEAFSGEIVDPQRTPALYRLIHKGVYMKDFIQPAIAGTTGGEYANLFGLLATSGGKSMKIMTSGSTFTCMGQQLNREGYYGKTYHNNTSTIYGRNVTHNLLGYSEGFMGKDDGMDEFLTTSGFPASDCEMMQGTFPTYVNHQPFNVYYMTVSGHGQYGTSINQMSAKNWSAVKDLPYNDMVKCYLANNMEIEYAMEYLLDALEEAGIADDTVICMSPDHFPYGLDQGCSLGNMPNLSELYGYNVSTYLERDHNSAVLWSGCLEKMDPIVIESPTSSLDLLPTLSNLFGVPFDSRLYPGRDIFSDAPALSFDSAYDWKTDLGTFYSSRGSFVPKDESIEIPEGYVDSVKAIVRNKMNFCKGVLQADYYGHIYNALYPDT